MLKLLISVVAKEKNLGKGVQNLIRTGTLAFFCPPPHPPLPEHLGGGVAMQQLPSPLATIDRK